MPLAWQVSVAAAREGHPLFHLCLGFLVSDWMHSLTVSAPLSTVTPAAAAH